MLEESSGQEASSRAICTAEEACVPERGLEPQCPPHPSLNPEAVIQNETLFSPKKEHHDDGPLGRLLMHMRRLAPAGRRPVQISLLAKSLPCEILESLPCGLLKFCKAHPSLFTVLDVDGVAFVRFNEHRTQQHSDGGGLLVPLRLDEIPPPPPAALPDVMTSRRMSEGSSNDPYVLKHRTSAQTTPYSIRMVDHFQSLGPALPLAKRLPSTLVALEHLMEIHGDEDKAPLASSSSPTPPNSTRRADGSSGGVRGFWSKIVQHGPRCVLAVAIERSELAAFRREVVRGIAAVAAEGGSEPHATPAVDALEHQKALKTEKASTLRAAGSDGCCSLEQVHHASLPHPSGQVADDGNTSSAFDEGFDLPLTAAEVKVLASLDKDFSLRLVDDLAEISRRLDELHVYVCLLPMYATIAEHSGVNEKCAAAGYFATTYDAYRAARFLSVSPRSLPLLHFALRVRDVVSSVDNLPFLILSFPQLFATNGGPGLLAGVSFLLNDVFIPTLSRTKSVEELRTEADRLRAEWKALPSKANHQRVKLKDLEESHRRAMHVQLRPSVFCDTSVLAHFIFDLLGEEAMQTGLVPTLLPSHIANVTNSKSKKFLKAFPHLFHIVEDPPLYLVQRADLKPEVIAAPANDEELVLTVLSVVTARLQVHKGKILLPSHCTKYLPRAARQRIAQLDKNLETFLRKRPEIFNLTDNIHATEPVITLNPLVPPR